MKLLAALFLSATMSVPVTVTGYVPGHAGNGHVGAMGSPVVPGMTCAVSRDLSHLKGRWIHVEGHGVRLVNDVTNKRFKRRVDLAMRSVKDAREHGKQTSKLRVKR